MPSQQTNPENLKRVNFNIPRSLHDELSNLAQERSTTVSEAIRSAISLWIEHEIAKEMEEGYRMTAAEHLGLMDEFKYVDQENW